MSEITIQTSCGRIKGTVRDGIAVFQGIDYASCERFEEAVPINSWDAVYDATRRGSVCPQRSCRLASVIGEEKGTSIDEKRLCLTVYAPENAAPGSLAVMVWVHGGSYLTGGSEEQRYSGERLVRKGNVLVVKISYRLGALGYLWLPEENIGNLGLKDQITALQWIQDHISGFGGDPSRITVFGQSAGAHSVASLIASSVEKPLFKRAVLQSPPLGINISPRKASRIAKEFLKLLAEARESKEASNGKAGGKINGKTGEKIEVKAGGKILQKPAIKILREASIDEILDAQEAIVAKNPVLAFMPILKEPTRIPEAIIKGRLQVVCGYAAQDASPFLKPAMDRLFGTKAGNAIVSFITKRVFAAPIEKYTEKLRKAGLQADIYHISWAPKGNPLGSCHCIELPFILGFKEDWTEAGMLEGITDLEYEKLSELFLEAWTDFANYGKFTELV